MFVTTHRGDQHLTVGVPAFLARYEQHVRNTQIVRMIVDREGMATEFLARLHAEGRNVVTILQTNQYRDLTSFSDVGTLIPLSTDVHGQVIREVAPASITLSREDHPDSPLCLQVALIRDLRWTVLVRPDPGEAQYPQRWDSDLPLDERTWWREGWQATAAPAKETIPKLIPIVTTVQTQPVDAIELAQTYIQRWPAQENIIKDYLLPLGLDTNHGFAKLAVENSEVAKRRARLELRLARLKQWAQSAGKREAQASRRRERLRTAYNQRSKELYRVLWEYQLSLEEQNLAESVFRQKLQEKFGGLSLAGIPERQSKAFDFFVSREPFLVSAFAFEQCKLLVKQRLLRFERQRRLETAVIPASGRKVECCSKQRAICPIEEDLSRSTHGIKSIITSDRHSQLRLSSAIVFAANSGVAPAGISKEPRPTESRRHDKREARHI
ncbi:hypothetical protein KSF_000750 [Reticulibacter mediterranei]|uniref:Uncharacterized protein n=1 Tax=Reticulibacter mediterranei TaxID=2778369 RepID=A0A8J3IEB8_9CHLR|nr:hypothetical protein KSF_000750 [Reticulibacter mediterranei]